MLGSYHTGLPSFPGAALDHAVPKPALTQSPHVSSSASEAVAGERKDNVELDSAAMIELLESAPPRVYRSADIATPMPMAQPMAEAVSHALPIRPFQQ